MQDMMREYFARKDVAGRSALLRQLALEEPEGGKEFFLQAFRKERYLDMKLCALRGYAAYATEDEVAPLMARLLELLRKRAVTTPCDYQEYEPMRSAFLMPYLLQRYGYDCFRAFHEQLEAQYAAMPDCFKGIFTLDEQGNLRELRDRDEVQRALSAWLEG